MASDDLTSIKWQAIRLFSWGGSRESFPVARTAADFLTPSPTLLRSIGRLACTRRTDKRDPKCVSGTYYARIDRRGEHDVKRLKEHGVVSVVSMSEDWEIAEQDWPSNMLQRAALEWYAF